MYVFYFFIYIIFIFRWSFLWFFFWFLEEVVNYLGIFVVRILKFVGIIMFFFSVVGEKCYGKGINV